MLEKGFVLAGVLWHLLTCLSSLQTDASSAVKFRCYVCLLQVVFYRPQHIVFVLSFIHSLPLEIMWRETVVYILFNLKYGLSFVGGYLQTKGEEAQLLTTFSFCNYEISNVLYCKQKPCQPHFPFCIFSVWKRSDYLFKLHDYLWFPASLLWSLDLGRPGIWCYLLQSRVQCLYVKHLAFLENSSACFPIGFL
jgi:hypothetical protein